MYIFSLHCIRPIAEVEKILPLHREFLKKYYAAGKLICSGPKNPRDGGVILCSAASEREARDIVEEDPFYRQNIAAYELTEFTPTMRGETFAACFKRRGAALSKINTGASDLRASSIEVPCAPSATKQQARVPRPFAFFRAA